MMYRVGFVGKSRIASAEAVLSPTVAAWREQWCYSHLMDLTVEVSESDPQQIRLLEESQEGDSSFFAINQGRGIGLFYVGERAWDYFVFADAASQVPHDHVMNHLCHTASMALINNILSQLHQQPVKQLDTSPDLISKLFAQDVLVVARFKLKDMQLVLLISANLFDSYLPPRSELDKKLVSRSQAILGATVNLNVYSNLLSLPISEIYELNAGDVVSGQGSIGQNFLVNIDGGKTVAQGVLGQQQGRTALQLK